MTHPVPFKIEMKSNGWLKGLYRINLTVRTDGTVVVQESKKRVRRIPFQIRSKTSSYGRPFITKRPREELSSSVNRLLPRIRRC